MMHVSLITSVLTFAFAFPIVMRYRLWPVAGTPYWLFGILFALLLTGILVPYFRSVRNRQSGRTSDRAPSPDRLRIILVCVLTITVGGTMMTAIVDRHRVAPVYGVHDVLLQQEAAMRFLLENRNPYRETYFGTFMEEFNYDELGNDAVNPALYHFLMPPWYLLSPFVVYVPAVRILGFFDGRMVSLLLTAGLVIVLFRWFRHADLGNLAVVLTVLAPAVFDYLIEGRSDIYPLFWLILSLALADRKRFLVGAIAYGLAFSSKQTAMFAYPFFLLLTYVRSGRSLRQTVIAFIVSGAVIAGLTLPFLMWNPNAFIDSVIRFPAGSTTPNFPVSGYGLGMILFSLGVIRDIHDQYPFFVWQAVIGIPVLVLFLKMNLSKAPVSGVLVGYATTLFAVWYTSRYFNNNHLGFLSTLYILGVVKYLDEEKSL